MPDFIATVSWIPKDAGGRERAPDAGFRCGVRWQRHIDYHLKNYNDVVINDVRREEGEDAVFSVSCSSVSEELPKEFLAVGSPVEFLDGYRVIGVGVVSE